MRPMIPAVPLIAALVACSAEERTPRNVTTVEAGEADPVADKATDPAASAVTTIPAAFHGEWNSDPAACGSGASDTRLRISGDRMRFYESAGEVRRVEIESEGVIEVTADYSGEGQSWTNERRLSLSDDGDTLTVSGDGATLARSRCP